MKFTGYKDNELFSIISPICEGFNTAVVHLSTAVVRTSLQIRLVVYRKTGIDLDTCSKISKALLPRLEVWSDNRDINLEVSSPGVGRVFKDAYEFEVFKGESAKILLDNEWYEGKILSADSKSVTMEIKNTKEDYSFDEIQKAKLV